MYSLSNMKIPFWLKVFAAFYIMASIILADFNIFNWEQPARVLYLVVGCGALVVKYLADE